MSRHPDNQHVERATYPTTSSSRFSALMLRLGSNSVLLLVALVWSSTGQTSLGQKKSGKDFRPEVESLLKSLENALPKKAAGLRQGVSNQVTVIAQNIEASAAKLAAMDNLRKPEQFVRRATELVALKTGVDTFLAQAVALRLPLTALPAGPSRRATASQYLQVISTLIDLSGRLRYLLYDVIYDVTFEVADQPLALDRLIAMLFEAQSSIGAAVVSDFLFDPPSDNTYGAVPTDPATKGRILELLKVAGSLDLLPMTARFVRDSQMPAELTIAAVETIRRLGLPQDPRPGEDPTLPRPAITAEELLKILGRINRQQLDHVLTHRLENLIEWLTYRSQHGLQDEWYNLGLSQVRPGDWLLMRNPSPYNLFTDLSPGLFTHVGVVASETSRDGRRRMVLVDLPERGTKLQATNIDIFVQRTLHYMVLRHHDPKVAQTMGQRARSAIGVSAKFDLNFRTDRILALHGQPLAGKTIHTYCAGLLLLCAQESGISRDHFFPITEHAASGKTVENLAQLGLSFGNDFVSPTGALFSSHFSIVNHRPPMYEPQREIEEAIYDYFANQMRDQILVPSPTMTQSLRLKLAEAARNNPLLTRALAKAAGVHENTDLVAAAKASAVVETLDEISKENSSQFLQGRRSIRSQKIAGSPIHNFPPEEIARIESYRQKHASLFREWRARELSPRDLRIALVEFYIKAGKRQLDARFFSHSENSR